MSNNTEGSFGFTNAELFIVKVKKKEEAAQKLFKLLEASSLKERKKLATIYPDEVLGYNAFCSNPKWLEALDDKLKFLKSTISLQKDLETIESRESGGVTDGEVGVFTEESTERPGG